MSESKKLIIHALQNLKKHVFDLLRLIRILKLQTDLTVTNNVFGMTKCAVAPVASNPSYCDACKTF